MKNRLLHSIILLFVCSSLFAQTGLDPYYMTEYSYTENVWEIGELKRHDNVPFTVIGLEGSAARFLKHEGNKLKIRENRVDRLFSKDLWDIVFKVRVNERTEKVRFNIVRDEFITNGVVAHRGAWTESIPQNSIAALRRAIELGCAASEFDVRMTVDGQVVVNHDATYNNVHIASSTYDEVRKLKLTNGETFPSLKEYLAEAIKQNNTRLVLEIKADSTSDDYCDRLVRAVMADIREIDAQEWITIITFSKGVMMSALKYEPSMGVGYLNGDLSPAELKKLGCWILNYNFKLFKEKPSLFEEARSAGVSVNVWTVNEREDMIYFMDHNVDRITTDKPDILIQLKKSK